MAMNVIDIQDEMIRGILAFHFSLNDGNAGLSIEAAIEQAQAKLSSLNADFTKQDRKNIIDGALNVAKLEFRLRLRW